MKTLKRKYYIFWMLCLALLLLHTARVNAAPPVRGFTVAAKKGDNTINILKENGIANIEEYDAGIQFDPELVKIFIDKVATPLPY